MWKLGEEICRYGYTPMSKLTTQVSTNVPQKKTKPATIMIAT